MFDFLRRIPEPVRAYIYRGLLLLSTIAVARGWLTEDDVSLWIPVVAALLGTGLATANTSR